MNRGEECRQDADGPLGFSYRRLKCGDVEILHHGRIASTLRGKVAEGFLEDSSDLGESELQHLMARLTGNYRRGNERVARNHPRNRR